MSIVVTCPNGHRLYAPDGKAGKTGRCPACGTEVKIPDPKNEPPSDSSILRILGIGEVLRKRMAEEEEAEARKNSPEPEKSERIEPKTRKMKLCPQCNAEIDAGYKVCPYCRSYLVKGRH